MYGVQRRLLKNIFGNKKSCEYIFFILNRFWFEMEKSKMSMNIRFAIILQIIPHHLSI